MTEGTQVFPCNIVRDEYVKDRFEGEVLLPPILRIFIKSNDTALSNIQIGDVFSILFKDEFRRIKVIDMKDGNYNEIQIDFKLGKVI